jgi:hypothetical protein
MMFRCSCKSAIAQLENSSTLWTLRCVASGRPLVNTVRVLIIVSEGTSAVAVRGFFGYIALRVGAPIFDFVCFVAPTSAL